MVEIVELLIYRHLDYLSLLCFGSFIVECAKTIFIWECC